MNIFRVEHMSVLNDGRPAGPYAENAFASAEHDASRDCDGWDCIHVVLNEWNWDCGARCPAPERDGLLRWPDDYLFGFTSVAQLRHWFDGKLRKLSRFGFVISVYAVDEVHTQHGGRQSVFSYRAAVRVDEVPILLWKTLDSTAAAC